MEFQSAWNFVPEFVSEYIGIETLLLQELDKSILTDDLEQVAYTHLLLRIGFLHTVDGL